MNHFAKKLFESVGMQSQIEGQKGVTLFDIILGILDQVIAEIPDYGSTQDNMEIDSEFENVEAAQHVQFFI